MQRRLWIQSALIAATLAAASACCGAAESAIKVYNLVELSGAGTTAGTNFKNGLEMAIKEINAAGGILGHPIESTTLDTQSQPSIAKALAQKAVDDEAFCVFGPVFTGSFLVSMSETQRAQIPNFTGGEGAAITEKGNPYVFRTSLTQALAMPKVARYMAESLKVKNLAVMYVNNDFGKGGRDAIAKAAATYGMTIVSDISTESGQVDFSAPVLKAKQANADALFVYTNEEESAHALRELRKQGYAKPIIGETTLTGQKVIELAGDSANGAVAHVGLTVDAPLPALKAFGQKFEKAYGYVPDHNGVKGYTAPYMLKAAIEKAGKLDRVAAAKALHGLTIRAAQNPGVLMDVAFDEKGDIDRESFVVEVKNGKQVVKEVLPPLHAAR